jgi:hypothetical protein
MRVLKKLLFYFLIFQAISFLVSIPDLIWPDVQNRTILHIIIVNETVMLIIILFIIITLGIVWCFMKLWDWANK